MYPMFVLAIALLLSLFMDGVASQYRDLTQRYASRVRQMQVIAVAENIEQFYLEKATFPADINTLSGTLGFEHARGSMDNWQKYAVSPILNDGIWQFSRVVLFSKDPSGGTTQASYLTANSCGTGAFSAAASWCGAKDSKWYRRETRERYNDQIMTQRARMNRLLQKLSDYYNVNSTFPDKDNLNVVLGLDSMTKLTTLVGYAGSANSCSGTFSYMTVPVDCGDMFDLWGNPIGYQFISKKRVLLTSETPIFNASAGRVVVVAEYDYSLI